VTGGIEWKNGQETGKESKLTPKAVANEHERRARQPHNDPSTTPFPVRAATPAGQPVPSGQSGLFKHRFGKIIQLAECVTMGSPQNILYSIANSKTIQVYNLNQKILSVARQPASQPLLSWLTCFYALPRRFHSWISIIRKMSLDSAKTCPTYIQIQ